MKKVFLLLLTLSSTLAGMEEGAHKRPLSDDREISESKRLRLTNQRENELCTENPESDSEISRIAYSLFLLKENSVTKQTLEEVCNYPCKLCSTIFSTSEDLKDHYSLMHEDTISSMQKDIPNGSLLFEFDINNSKSSVTRRLTNGIVDPRDNQPAINNSSSFITLPHEKAAKPYPCDYLGCNKSFSRADSLKDHKRIHAHKKPYACIKCSQSFTHRKQLVRHEQKAHTQGPKIPIINQAHKSDYPQHNKATIILDRPEIYQYDLPKYHEVSISHSPTIGQSSLLFTYKKTYTCDYPGCNKFFISQSALTDHKRVHTGEKPYACKKCGEFFTYRYQLSQHNKKKCIAQN